MKINRESKITRFLVKNKKWEDALNQQTGQKKAISIQTKITQTGETNLITKVLFNLRNPTSADEVAQVHRSPGFITSNLIGKREDGTMIKEFEASHGTVTDLWHMHLRGEETSFNPLGLVEAIIGAMQHAAVLQLEASGDDAGAKKNYDFVMNFTTTLRTSMHNTFRYGQGTRDMSGPTGLTTEDFVDKVAWRLERYLVKQEQEAEGNLPTLGEPSRTFRRNHQVDPVKMKSMFEEYDLDGNGSIDYDEFESMLVKLGVAPKKDAVVHKEKVADV